MRHLPHMGIYIERSPEEVFAYVLDIAQTPAWRPRMSEVAWTGYDPPGVGSRFRVTVKMVGVRFHFDLEVTAFDPPRHFAYRQETGLIKVDAAMEWLRDGNGCWYLITGNNRTDNLLMKAATPLFRSSLLWQDFNDLLRLKAVLENRTE